MEVKIDKIQDIDIVNVSGKIDNSTSANFLKLVQPCLDNKVSKMVINFKDVDYISSAGIRSLIMVCKTMQASGGKIVLTEANVYVLSVLKMAGIHEVIPIMNHFEEVLRFMEKN